MGRPGISLPSGGVREPYRLLDLFSGIGGFSLGLERTGGFRTVAFCEISSKCRHLLNHHWLEVPAYDDICTLTADRLRDDGIAVDAICGGFPCQDLSFAGKGAGLAGERSGLWREYARLIRELRPRVVVVENVAALLGRGLGVVLGDLAELGYDAVWDRVRAFDVGAPHLRARLWIVAYARGVEHEGFGHAFSRALAEELLEAALANSGYVGHGANDAAGEDPSAARTHQGQGHQRKRVRAIAGRGRKVVADADTMREPQPQGLEPDFGGWAGNGGDQGWRGQWAAEPDVGRVAHGVPARVDRLHGLGNAVVPEIPYRLGKAILAAVAGSRTPLSAQSKSREAA